MPGFLLFREVCMPLPGQGNPGMDPNVQAALQRRGVSAGGNGALTQVSPQAPMAQPVPQIDPSAMTQSSAPAGPPTPTTPPKFEPQDRTDLITMALIEQMKNDNKLVKEQTKMASAQPAPQAPPVAPINPPMGGGGPSWSNSWVQPSPMATSQKQGTYNYGMGTDYSGMTNYGNGTGA